MLQSFAVLAAIAASAVAVSLYDSRDYPEYAFLAWLISWSLPLLVLLLWERRTARTDIALRGGSDLPPDHQVDRVEASIIVLLLLLAAFLRIKGIETIPPQLHNDEMNTGLAARSFLAQKHEIALFGISWQTQPGLGFYLASLFMSILGDSLWGFRTSSAVYGLICLLLMFGCIRILFGSRVALISLLLAACSPLHIHFSRTGFQQMQALTYSMAALYGFLYGLRAGSLTAYALAGVMLGIALQTYTISLLVPLIMAFVLLFRLFRDRTRLRQILITGAVTAVFSALTIAPTIRLIIHDPDAFARRARHTVWVFSEANKRHIMSAVGSDDILPVIKHQISWTFQTLFPGQDGSQEFNFHQPLVNYFLLIPSLAGFIILMRKLTTLPSAVMLLWFILTLILGGIITVNTPYLPRLVGLTFVLPVFPAVAVSTVLELENRYRNILSWVLRTLTVLGAAACIWQYFSIYPGERPEGGHDCIIALLREHPEVQSLVVLTPLNGQFGHEAWKFNDFPSVARIQAMQDARLLPLISSSKHPLLVVFSPGMLTPANRALLDSNGASCAGYDGSGRFRQKLEYCVVS